MQFNKLSRVITDALPFISLPSRPVPDDYVSILLIDVSPSMNETDFFPSRLHAAKSAALQFTKERAVRFPKAWVAIAGFGEMATLVCSLTCCANSRTIEADLARLSTINYTNITSGLLVAESLFNMLPSKRATREVRLLTDGYHNVGPMPHEVASRLKASGCFIHTVGIGGSASAVDEELLREICSRNESGEPLYEFLSDQKGLMRYFTEAGGLTR